MNDKISIIIPVYNIENYLARCIESVVNQSFTNLEIILVDDGSKDDSGIICDAFAKKDPRINVIHKTNGGLSEARNVGIDVATGNLIGFVDGDDFIHPDMYDALYQNLIKYKADISQCFFLQVIDNQFIKPDEFEIPTVYNKIEALYQLFTPYMVPFVVVWNKLYKKEVFKSIRFPLNRIHEDESVTYQLFYESTTLVSTKARYYYYFQSSNSIIRSDFSIRKFEFALAMREQISFFDSNHLIDLKRIALEKYASWLLSFYYRYKTAINKEADLKIKIKTEYTDIRKELTSMNKKLPSYSIIIYKLSGIFPWFFGFLNFNKIYRRNIVGKITSFIYNYRVVNDNIFP